MSSLTIIGRATWGAGPLRSGALIDHARFVGLAVHHTVMVMADYDRDGFLHGDLDDIKRYMKALQVARPDLGGEVPYSWVVFRGRGDHDAVVCEGRGFGVTGAHTAGYNSTRYGVAYAGNASVDRITPGVLDGYRWVGSRLVDPVRAERTFGHRDVKSTECPGNRLYALLGRLQPPFTTEEDDMTPNELAEAIENNGRLRKAFKGLIQGSGLDALREPKEGVDDRGLWRSQVEDIINDVLDKRAPAQG